MIGTYLKPCHRKQHIFLLLDTGNAFCQNSHLNQRNVQRPFSFFLQINIAASWRQTDFKVSEKKIKKSFNKISYHSQCIDLFLIFCRVSTVISSFSHSPTSFAFPLLCSFWIPWTFNANFTWIFFLLISVLTSTGGYLQNSPTFSENSLAFPGCHKFPDFPDRWKPCFSCLRVVENL